ncbi:3-deoxy-D-manno-octulosonic acid kinase [Vibrio genomosp. F10 str. 9ZC157]|uniref:3-deoxy-D-manno-octulosonic acid kinase n=1 Tax=Vibrio genomosp. F10 str. ZF-129 TaxID=1187848 RepID=A0A1E5BDB0_9VIBR|nr:3-deoxy-D-manno-octulosonic acid kinase [Vibrio genomosp. F10]OEE33095.1 3-deoxy-D-manno-octulosonic acid kinase [Vibrio genomosp. F10 str. ZF-129]OEE95596.1 3-deoxy-D-manno-octulosonic acid kinase [Vibrio genomosp. F10 str. 9ZC157]
MFTTKQISNTTYWYDPLMLTEDVESAFSIDYWKENQAILGSAQGRGTTWFVKGEKADFALRHYHRGGLFGKLVRDSYWFTGLKTSRAFQEVMLLKLLTENNVNVPAPVAAKVSKNGLTYKADILVQKLPHAEDLVKILSNEKLSNSDLRNIGRQIRKMHDVNVNHTDLNIHNILIDKDKKVWIIDFDKCRTQSCGSWKASNLDRLQRSFEKEARLGHIRAASFDFSEIKKGYGESTLDYS